MNVTIDFYFENDVYGAFIGSDNGSGITVNGSTAAELANNLVPYLTDFAFETTPYPEDDFNPDAIKTDIESKYYEFIKKNDQKPLAMDCTVNMDGVDDGCIETIALYVYDEEHPENNPLNDDEIFFYVDSIEELLKLVDPSTNSDFYITGFHGFWE